MIIFASDRFRVLLTALHVKSEPTGVRGRSPEFIVSTGLRTLPLLSSRPLEPAFTRANPPRLPLKATAPFST